jgi:hypothetical protein
LGWRNRLAESPGGIAWRNRLAESPEGTWQIDTDLISPDTMTRATFLCRFGIFLAWDAGAHGALPQLPMVTPEELRMAYS